MNNKAYLILENGVIFEGKSFGSGEEVVGEIVFTTAMTGYLETLTDPSYYGQLVVQTFPLIGNYGVIHSDFEGDKPYLKAYIVKNWCEKPSNFRSEGDIDTFLKENNITGLYDIDTRKLTKIIREHGVMNGRITTVLNDEQKNLEDIKKHVIKDAVKSVSTKEKIEMKSEESKYKVALWDFGTKANIARELVARGCDVTVMPSTSTANDILSINPDGIMLSNGPGDPIENKGVISELKKLCEAKKPMFGICLGHQLLALSQGATTKKLRYGHRGENQPAKDIRTGRVYITSQNHGYEVVNESLPAGAELSFINVNDSTCEGIIYTNMPAFTVQFHPEAAAGPLDTAFLFDEFIKVMEGER